MASPHPVLIAGIAALFFLSRRKGGTESKPELKPGPVEGTAETPKGEVLGGDDLEKEIADEVSQILKSEGFTDQFIQGAIGMPKLQSGNEVVFNLSRTEFAIGATWRYATLDSWLNVRREAGWLETKTDEATTYIQQMPGASLDQLIDDIWRTVSVPLAGGVGAGSTLLAMDLLLLSGVFISLPVSTAAAATAAGFSAFREQVAIQEDISEEKALRIEKTAALALQDFIKEHDVLVGPERFPLKINELGITPATIDFLSVIANYIVRFQASTYS